MHFNMINVKIAPLTFPLTNLGVFGLQISNEQNNIRQNSAEQIFIVLNNFFVLYNF